MKRQIYLWASVAALLLPLAAISPAWALTQIPRGTAAYFEGGVDSVDTYPGVPGDGWATEWKTRIQDATYSALDVTVSNAAPLATGTNNYAYVDMEALKSLSGSKAPYATLGRKYDALAIDPTQDYTVSALFRVDASLYGLPDDPFFTSSSDRYQIYQGTSSTQLAAGGGSASTWIMGAYGAASTAGNGDPIAAGNWTFNDYLTGTNYTWDTGISLTQGTTYAVEVTVHPNYTWDATISDGVTTFNKNNMGCRNQAVSGGYVEFFGKADVVGDLRQFSVDSVVVAQSGFNTVGGLNLVAAHFNGGNSTTEVDGYTGAVGNGWNTAWQKKTSNATLTTTVVSPGDLDYNELESGTGAYLSLSASGDAGGNVGIARDYSCVNVDGIDWTQAHTIEFKVRIDEDVDNFLSKTFTGIDDRYQITDNSSTASTTHPNNTWAISSFGAANELDGGNVTADMVGKWCFQDGTGDGTVAGLVNSGIALTTGGVYDFTIVVDPTDKTYDVTVSDGTTTASVSDLGWRTLASNVGGFINFVCGVDATDDVRAWSVDEIIISSNTTESIPGDTNNDGKVDATDAGVLAGNWGMSGSTGGATVGDFNGDGFVNATDASILAANWTGSGEGTAVPEPGSLILIGLGTLMLAFRRPRAS